MQHFFKTVTTVEDGLGFSHFDHMHLAWLGAFVLFAVCCCITYRRADAHKRRRLQLAMAGLIIADEMWKWFGLLVAGVNVLGYLPLHLCSINIFLIAAFVMRPGPVLGNFLYLVCIPGALAALLFPTWMELPLANFMHLHSFTVHILLAVFPMMVTAGGDIVPDPRQIPRCLALLVALAIPVWGVNVLLDKNFMFLMYAEAGNPLKWFETAFGDHRIGFPVIILAVIVVMYLPWVLARHVRHARA